MKLLTRLKTTWDLRSLSRQQAIAVSIPVLGAIAGIDHFAGLEIPLGFFYLIPISLMTWHWGIRIGIVVSTVAATLWTSAEVANTVRHLHPLLVTWNELVKIIFLGAGVFAIDSLNKSLQREAALTLEDSLTGIGNNRAFYRAIESERARAVRYQRPFTLLYLDVDNFKDVNDQLGHAAGDKVLVTVARILRSQIRRTDLAARIGGDEFAVLLTESNEQSGVCVAAKVRSALAEAAAEMGACVTVSIGVLPVTTGDLSDDAMLKKVDHLMYAAKRAGKNRVATATTPLVV
jgi:diguanylate cyclase (GGDEF)-like protein